MYICLIFFIHPAVDRFLDWFYRVAIINDAPGNMGVQVSLWHVDISLHTYPCRCCVSWVLPLSGISLLCVIAILIYKPTYSAKGSMFVHSHGHLFFILFVFFILLNEVALIWSVFPWWLAMLSIFSCMFLFLYVLFTAMSFLDGCPGLLSIFSLIFFSWVFGIPCIFCVLTIP